MKLVTAKDARNKYERGLVLLQEMQLHRITLGLVLIDIEETNSCSLLGFDSFNAFCSSPITSGGFGLRERTRQTTMQVAKTFVLELGIQAKELLDVAYSNLAIVVPIVNRENLEEVLADAKCLGARDLALNKKMGKYTGGTAPYDAENENDRRMTICPNCGTKF